MLDRKQIKFRADVAQLLANAKERRLYELSQEAFVVYQMGELLEGQGTSISEQHRKMNAEMEALADARDAHEEEAEALLRLLDD